MGDVPAVEPLEAIETDDAVALDRMVQEIAARIASYDVALGTSLQAFLAVQGWKRLGYSSEQHYIDERLGIARATALRRVTLARRMKWLEGRSDSLQAGEVGYEQASLIARVASPDTLDAWIERARERTFEHLREEVAAVEFIARANGEVPRALAPPTDEELAAVQEFERGVLSGKTFAQVFSGSEEDVGSLRDEGAEEDVQMSACSAPEREGADEEDVQMSACFAPGPRRRWMRVRVREDVALLLLGLSA